MNRRHVIAGAIGAVAAGALLRSAAQSAAQDLPLQDLLQRIDEPVERQLWALRLDAIWLPLLTVLEEGALREAGGFGPAFESYIPTRNRILPEEALPAVAEVLADANRRAEIEKTIADVIAPKLPALFDTLETVGVQRDSPVARNGADAVIVYSQFLLAQSSDEADWLCRVWGFRIIFC